MDVQTAYIAASFFGMLLHGVKRWATGETRCVTYYFTTDFPKNTAAAVVANMIAVVTALHYGVLEGVSWQYAVMTGILQGFGADAGLNKGQRVIWSSEERERKLRK